MRKNYKRNRHNTWTVPGRCPIIFILVMGVCVIFQSDVLFSLNTLSESVADMMGIPYVSEINHPVYIAENRNLDEVDPLIVSYGNKDAEIKIHRKKYVLPTETAQDVDSMFLIPPSSKKPSIKISRTPTTTTTTTSTTTSTTATTTTTTTTTTTQQQKISKKTSSKKTSSTTASTTSTTTTTTTITTTTSTTTTTTTTTTQKQTIPSSKDLPQTVPNKTKKINNIVESCTQSSVNVQSELKVILLVCQPNKPSQSEGIQRILSSLRFSYVLSSDDYDPNDVILVIFNGFQTFNDHSNTYVIVV